MGKRLFQNGARNLLRRLRRPLTAAGEAAGEHQDIVGVVCNSKWVFPQVVECKRGAKGRDDQVLPLLDQADGSDVHSASTALRNNDALADHRLLRALRLVARVVPA